MNRVIMIGRLTRDPELKTTTTGKRVAEFGIAVDKRFKSQDGQDADFFRVKVWDRQADFAVNYLSKGRLVALEGRLDQRKYIDKDGNNREIIEITADNLQGLDRPRQDGEGGGGSGAPAGGTSGGGAAPEAEYDPFADE